jgi:Amt family ammonium transporter
MSPLRVLINPSVLSLLLSSAALAQGGETNSGDTAWVLISTALVLLMTPALGLFYAGLVRSKNALNTFMMSIAAMGVVTVVWVLLAYSLTFAPGNGFIGGLGHALLNNVGLVAKEGLSISHLLFVVFQSSFAIITAALISGAVVERVRFIPFLVFMGLWTLLVYAPLAHWVWGGGWLQKLGVLDFAGGVPVEMASGFSALAAALVVGVRKDYGRQALLPHNVPLVLLGAGLLWFGWFGFNGGSALAAGGSAVLAFTNTLLAPAATLLAWMILDLSRTGKATAVGAATAIIVGAVAITPSAGFLGPVPALLLGAVAAVPSYFFILWRARTRLDESLDVLAAHGLGGITGMLFTGLFAQKSWNGIADGLLFGNPAQFGLQALAVAATVLYAFGVTWLIMQALSPIGLRASSKDERLGMDVIQHGEEAYTSGEGAILVAWEPRDVKRTDAGMAR